jgi:hypothetical protein
MSHTYQDAANTNFVVFDWTRLKPMIFCTQGEHVNHYTTDAVNYIAEENNSAIDFIVF